MRVHKKTFYECIRSRAFDAGLSITDLLKKTGIATGTFYYHKSNGGWTQQEIAAMHRYLHFTAEDLQIFAEGR